MSLSHQIFFPLNHWTELQQLLSVMPGKGVIVVNSWEQKEFIESISQDFQLKVFTQKQWAFAQNKVFDSFMLWPFEQLEESEVYYELASEQNILWLSSWSLNDEQQKQAIEHVLLNDQKICVMKNERWRPYLNSFWQRWQQEVWRREFCWGRKSTVVYADEKDLRELKRFFKEEEISYLKKSLIPLAMIKNRVPAFEEDICFTFRASQAVEYRYFQGFQHRPQMRIYLIQYLKLILEKILTPLRPI